MAQTLTVKPEYVNKAQVFFDGKTTLLNNNLTQEQLLSIYLKPEFRAFIDITYTNIADSFPENFEIDPNLFHAYDSGEVTHNPAAVYPAGTAGKALIDTKAKIDGFDGAFVSPTTAPSFQMNFAGGKFWNPRIPFSRNSIGTYIDHNGVMRTAVANKPRFTHDPVTKESLGLLIEEARTNLATYSNDFTNVSFAKSRITAVTGGSVLSPDLSSATKLVEDTTANNSHQLSKSDCVVAAGLPYTASIFLKAGERSSCALQMVSAVYGGVTPAVLVDLGLGTLSNSTNNLNAKIENYGNGWFRISITASVVTAGTSGLNIQFVSNGTPVYTGDGTSGVYIFGMQFEQGLNATSYIPTTAATVIRATDTIDITGTLFSELFPNFTEGTIHVNAKKANLRGAGNYKYYLRFRGLNNNVISVTDNDNGAVYNEISKDGLSLFNYNGVAFNENEYVQNVFGFQLNNCRAYQNGIASTLDTDCAMPVGINQLTIGGSINTIIKSIAIWPRRMTDGGMFALSNPNALVGKNPIQLLSAAHLGSAAFVSALSIALGLNRQEFPLYGTGASISVNIRRNYDFGFKILDSSGVTSITAQPSADCTADTDNTLTFTAPIGKTLVYEISPKF